jgi:hypothetical protein
MWIKLKWHRIEISNEMLCIQQLNFWYHERKVKGRTPVPIEQEGGWASEPFWRSREREQSFTFPGFENRTVQPVA